MKNNPLIGAAAILAALAYCFQSLSTASAIGPSVSLGSNPIFMEHGEYTTSSVVGEETIFTASSDQDTVIVRADVNCDDASSNSTFKTSGGAMLSQAYEVPHVLEYERLGVVLRSGESLVVEHTMNGSSPDTCGWIVMGYYMHP